MAQQGWSVFWDLKFRAGDDFHDRIEKEIETAGCMIVAWSKSSRNSNWVKGEATLGLDRHILIPIKLESVNPPINFIALHTENFVDWNGDSNTREFINLIEAIENKIGARKTDGSPNKTDLASRQPVKKQDNPKQTSFIEPEMIKIPPGCFQMGSDQHSTEQPIHSVTIAKPFWLAMYPVTFDEYELFVKDRKLEMPSDQDWGSSRPVINVRWDDAMNYAEWLAESTGKAYRLPTEAEWEYAARAGTTTDYYWGDKNAEDYAWFDNNSNHQTHPVGEKKPNEFGLYDMASNVWEWVQDCWHENYQSAPTDGSAWEKQANGDCGRRVIRGGFWNYKPESLRSAYRFWSNPVNRCNNIGFRLAQD